MKFSRYMDPDLIVFLDAANRDEALKKMIQGLDEAGKIDDLDAFYQAVAERERIVSTGIGMGIAVPHAKLPSFDNFFIAIGILQKGVDWKAIDSTPVRLIFMIGGPDDKQTEYLQILSNLTTIIKDEARRKKLLTLNSKEAIMHLFDTL